MKNTDENFELKTKLGKKLKISYSEVDNLIQAKIKDLNGFINELAAIHIIAKNKNLKFDSKAKLVSLPNNSKQDSKRDSNSLWNFAKFEAKCVVSKSENDIYTNYSLSIINGKDYSTKMGASMSCQLSKENILVLIQNLQQIIK